MNTPLELALAAALLVIAVLYALLLIGRWLADDTMEDGDNGSDAS